MIATRTIPLGDTTITVHLRGAGPLCVLVHGFPLNASMWLDVMQSELAQSRTLCAIDLRGHGQSPYAGNDKHGMELLADDVAAVIRTLSDDPVDIVALSMGGYAMLAFAERHAALLRSLTLVDTRAGADPKAIQQARRDAIESVLEHGRHQLALQMLQKLVAPACGPLVLARLQNMIEHTPIETIVADQLGMIERPDRHAVLHKLAVPGLIVVGELDAMTPVAMAEQMAEAFAGSRLEVIADAGHMSPMEAPAEFVRILADFLQ